MSAQKRANKSVEMAEERGMRDKSVEEMRAAQEHTPEEPVLSGDCEGGECWHNPETGYLEACPKHESQGMEAMRAKDGQATPAPTYKPNPLTQDGWTPISIADRQDDARAWIVCATEHPDPSRREEAVSLIAEGLAAIRDRSTTDDRRGIASLDEQSEYTDAEVGSGGPESSAGPVDARRDSSGDFAAEVPKDFDQLTGDEKYAIALKQAEYWQKRAWEAEAIKENYDLVWANLYEVLKHNPFSARGLAGVAQRWVERAEAAEARIATLEAELKEARVSEFNLGVDMSIDFILGGRFLHDEAPGAKFAIEVAVNLPRIKRPNPEVELKALKGAAE
jgi:hypothetical protein